MNKAIKTATEMRVKYGKDAYLEARKRCTEKQEEADVEGTRKWKDVVIALSDIALDGSYDW